MCAFAQALEELDEEGGIVVRHRRYCENQKRLVAGLERLGLQTLLPPDLQSPIITSFLFPDDERFGFASFYDKMKSRRFVLYPGKVSNANSFRIGYSEDMARAYLDVIKTDNTVGKTYNIAQEEVITLKDFILESAKALRLKPELISVPLEELGEMAGDYASMINLVPDIAAAKRDFGFTHTPFPEFAASSALWFRDNWNKDKKGILETRPRELEFAKNRG